MKHLLPLIFTLLFLGLVACDGSSTEEPSKEEDTAQTDGTQVSDAVSDLATDTSVEADTPLEDGPADIPMLDTRQEDSVDAPDTSPNCELPGLQPSTGPSTGGTLVDIVGYDVYIGALSDWVIFGDEVLAPLYQTDAPACGLPFVTPPKAPGTYPVWAFYGDPSQKAEVMQGDPIGTFTVVASDAPIGLGLCSQEADCAGVLETCDLGLGQCVTNVCLSTHCADTWQPGTCDPIQGCVDGCTSDTDCKLLYNSCGCQAVPSSDPRTQLTACALGSCVDCLANRCDQAGLKAACVQGVCTEAVP